jgi:cellobiose-specific phosphotransferase system component IIA
MVLEWAEWELQLVLKSGNPCQNYFKLKEQKKQSTFINPIDKDKISENPHSIEYAHHAGSALIKPEDKGKLKSRALDSMEQQTDMQLGQIYEQMQLLAEQAKKLNDRKRISEFIYTAEMRFEPFINHTYHLYQKDGGDFMLSLVGPKQWGKSGAKLEFVGTVKLLADHTWDILERSEKFDF